MTLATNKKMYRTLLSFWAHRTVDEAGGSSFWPLDFTGLQLFINLTLAEVPTIPIKRWARVKASFSQWPHADGFYSSADCLLLKFSIKSMEILETKLKNKPKKVIA